VNTGGFSESTVARWIGNSKEVLSENYLQAMQSDLDRATGRVTSKLTSNLTSFWAQIVPDVAVREEMKAKWDQFKKDAKERFSPVFAELREKLKEAGAASGKATPAPCYTPTGTRTPVSRMRT
jgi:hypothetical protein